MRRRLRSSRLRKKAEDRLLTRAAQKDRTLIYSNLQSHDREGVVLQNPVIRSLLVVVLQLTSLHRDRQDVLLYR